MTVLQKALFRELPATETLLQELAAKHEALVAGVPRPLLKNIVNSFLDVLRTDIQKGTLEKSEEITLPVLITRLIAHIEVAGQPHLRRVLNATGVVLHTNLGRSLLAPQALEAVHNAGAWYSNVEFDLATGERGSRYSHVEALLCSLTGAEAALVVNNNAAAVLLLLDTFCKGKEVIVSRGELVEIGGSFRIPEVMEKSGCILKEVGATNRTHAKDYVQNISEQTAAFLKVHTSNYRLIGFTKEVSLKELARLAHEHGLPAFNDLGSGSLLTFEHWGIPAIQAEPTVQESIAANIDVVTFSGDKVLGGPQAGILVGKKKYVDAMKVNPLTRALRIDKLTLAALEATLRLYTDPNLACTQIPVLRMLRKDAKSLHLEAKRLLTVIQKRFAISNKYTFSLRKGASRVGGGAFPEYDLPTTLVCISGFSCNDLREKLLQGIIPLVGRVEDDSFCLDPRTLQNDEFALVAEALFVALVRSCSK